MKKVLFIFDALKRGGAEISTLEITALLDNWTPVVVSIYQGTELKKEFEKKVLRYIFWTLNINLQLQKLKKELNELLK